MDRIALIAYTIGIGFVAVYLIYQQLRTARLFDELELILEEHLHAWNHRQAGRLRKNSRSQDNRFRQYHYAYKRLEPETLASVRVLLKHGLGRSSYVSGLFGLLLKFWIPALAFLLGLAVSETGGDRSGAVPSAPGTSRPADMLRIVLAGEYAPVTAFVLTLFVLALIQLVFRTYRANKIAFHMLVIEHVLESRVTEAAEIGPMGRNEPDGQWNANDEGEAGKQRKADQAGLTEETGGPGYSDVSRR